MRTGKVLSSGETMTIEVEIESELGPRRVRFSVFSKYVKNGNLDLPVPSPEDTPVHDLMDFRILASSAAGIPEVQIPDDMEKRLQEALEYRLKNQTITRLTE